MKKNQKQKQTAVKSDMQAASAGAKPHARTKQGYEGVNITRHERHFSATTPLSL